jgi:pyruvate,water dikinase
VTATRLLVNLSEPSQVERTAALEVDGVGLLRAEMMVLEALDGAHPRQLIEEGRSAEFVERMSAALSVFAAGFQSRPVTYRTIDFRTNEFRNLRGGDRFEPREANPMIGYRGALRYVREPEVFALEMEAVRRVWDAGHENFHVMLPSCARQGSWSAAARWWRGPACSSVPASSCGSWPRFPRCCSTSSATPSSASRGSRSDRTI